MPQGLDSLIASTVLFVAWHFILSSDPVRASLTERLGGRAFLGLYAAVALATLVWIAVAYAGAPSVPIWPRMPALAWLSVVVMPFAFILLAAGVTTPSPTGVATEAAPEPPPCRGIVTVTRHPVLWAIALWAMTHILAAGDAASLIMMGGLSVLALGGMWHIDRRREATLGSAWGPVLLTTSAIPFAAILASRTRLDWAGIGWWRPALGLALYGIFAAAHQWLFGVGVYPV